MSAETERTQGGFDEDPLVVAAPRRMQLSQWQKIGVAGLVATVFLAFIWVDNALHSKSAARAETTIQPNMTAFRPTPLVMAEPIEPPTPPAAAKTATNEVTPAQSPIMAFGGGGGVGDAAAPTAAVQAVLAGRPSGQVVPALDTGAASGAAGLAEKLKPTALQGAKAELLPHPDMLITKGTIIPCTLLTAINTELAGFVKCVLPEAIRGTTGNVVLLDKGTTVVGEIQQGLTQGQNRVFILWDRAETPNHAILSLGSPGADELGRPGVDGAVNDHFWRRFGSALMLSVVQGALQAGTAAAGNSSNGGGTTFNNFSSNGQQLANTSLQASINISPTLEKAQGANVSIFIARDIDFSDVYQLALAK
jgi:type IV secretion system protein VirB10